MADKRFRGAWSPQLSTPVKQQFLPTPPPQAPKAKPPPPDKKEAPQPPPEPVVVPPPAHDKLKKPPPEANGCVNINDRYNDYRSYIADDGTCINNLGQIIGYINKESFECGSADERYLGCIKDTNTNLVEVFDNNDELAGSLDQGTCIIKDGSGKIVGEIEGTGECKGHYGAYLGRFNGFGYRDMKMITLYLVLIDPGMLNEVEG